jgi:NACalpha-BTF3-like transcription factor
MKNEEELQEIASPLAKGASYSQLGAISEPSLSALRDQIKTVMIPMLIKIFQLKLEMSQAVSLPSRFQSKGKETPEQITAHLKSLDEDLKLLMMWCESSRNQIAKAISLPEEEQKNATKATASSSGNPSVAKSFSDAVSAQASLFKSKEEPKEKNSQKPASLPKKAWWRRFFP